MGCESKHQIGGCSCGCHESDHIGPLFWTKEKITRLEEYLDDLREEVNAIEERITALKQEDETDILV